MIRKAKVIRLPNAEMHRNDQIESALCEKLKI